MATTTARTCYASIWSCITQSSPQPLAPKVAGKIDAATLRKGWAQIESGSARGKIVLEGF